MENVSEIITTNQGIAILVLVTAAATLGLVLTGLVVQALNLVKVTRAILRVEILEARILARLLMAETKEETEALMTEIPGTTPVTLEDLARRDLMEQMGKDPDLMTPATDQEILEVLKGTLGKETNQPTTVKVATTERVEKTET